MFERRTVRKTLVLHLLLRYLNSPQVIIPIDLREALFCLHDTIKPNAFTRQYICSCHAFRNGIVFAAAQCFVAVFCNEK